MDVIVTSMREKLGSLQLIDRPRCEWQGVWCGRDAVWERAKVTCEVCGLATGRARLGAAAKHTATSSDLLGGWHSVLASNPLSHIARAAKADVVMPGCRIA